MNMLWISTFLLILFHQRFGRLWLVLYAVSFLGCPPTPYSLSLPTRPPHQSPKQLKVQWFRSTFYKLYLIEKKKKDGFDRIRTLIKNYPQFAKMTYQMNKDMLNTRRNNGEKVTKIDVFYYTMNEIIRQSDPASSISQPPKKE